MQLIRDIFLLMNLEDFVNKDLPSLGGTQEFLYGSIHLILMGELWDNL